MTRTSWCGLILLIGASMALADQIALVQVGQDWKFFKGLSEPTEPVSQWRELDYADNQWYSGPSGYSYGLGSSEEATRLSDMAGRYTSLYLRKKFVVSDLPNVKWLALRIDYNSGFVAYLNGREVARRGLTGDPVPYDAAASPHNTGYGEEIDLTAYVGELTQGTNVLAIQAHSRGLSGGSFSVSVELLANFVQGPLVQSTTPTGTKITWKTLATATSMVEYGTTPALGASVTSNEPTTNHVVALTNLEPDTLYYYRIASSKDEVTASSPLQSFRTFKESGNLSFLVFGDSGSGWVTQYKVANAIQRAQADLVLHTGDIVYYLMNQIGTDLRCLSVYQPMNRSIPFFFSCGNHDINYTTPDGLHDPSTGDRYFLNGFVLPTNSASGTEHYYSFDHGDAHFVALFLPTLGFQTIFPQHNFSLESAQYQWLTNDLAQSDKPWKFLFFHAPVMTSSLHRWDDNNGNGNADRVELQQILLPVAERYGVQMIFNGHDHNYERFAPTNGVHCVVTAGGGAGLYPMSARDPASAQFRPLWHYLRIGITNETLTLRAIDHDGQLFDSMTISRTMPPARTYAAAWHAPAIETEPANDGDGNINGQAFDFTGEPIPTVAGRSSNLGRFWVNNDSNHLYLAFEQAMVYGNHNLFLFLESPRLEGRTNLAGLGNGVVDPNAEGVDGLDLIENLAFTNFSPAIGCVLGDEYGDGNFRSFTRTGLSLDIGQGLFRLNQTFGDVPGIRLQQYNRSPQTGLEAGEQKADLIEIAVPLSELGGVQPGEIIKVGAVVGLAGYDPNSQFRELDTSLLGQSLKGAGMSNVVLEGLPIRLAINPDVDGDGLVDAWEQAHGLNPESGSGPDGPAGDPDGDGMSNLEEQIAGTHPRDPASLLQARIRLPQGGVFLITWDTVPGKRYFLEAANHAPFGFAPIADDSFPRQAAGPLESYSESARLGANPSARFYRVRILP